MLALIAWPVVHAVANPALRRAFPRTALIVAGLVLVGVVGAIGLAVWRPRVFHGVAAIAAGGALFALVRARAGYGSSRQLPPGRLSPLPFDYLIDPDYFRKGFNRYGTVFKMHQFGIGAGPNPFRGVLQPVCCVGLQQGRAVLNSYDAHLTPPPIPSSRFIPKKYLREMNRGDHRRYRTLFANAFEPGVVDDALPFMRRHIRASLLNMAVDSARGARAGVRPEPRLLEMNFGIFAHCFFGIGPDRSQFPRLRELAEEIDLSNRDDRQVNRSLEELADLLREETQRGLAGGGQAVRSFLSEAIRREPGLFDDLTAVRNLIYIMHASWTDMSGLIVWLFRELTERPEWLSRVANQGAATAGNDLLSVRCVRETLRMRQSEYLYRKVLKNVQVGDYVIPEGWLIRVCVRESHRDPDIFRRPDEFNPDRFIECKFSRAEYSTFGASRIACLGGHLALALGRAFVEEMAACVRPSTQADGPLEYRRWHWKPSSKWRVRLSPVVQAD